MLRQDSFIDSNIDLREEVTAYIEQRHLEDGGYFFARITPSSGMDTYYAVKSLAILGKKPDHPETVVNFFLGQIRDGKFGGIPGVFVTIAVLNDLGYLTDAISEHAKQQIMATQNTEGGFGFFKNIDVEIPSELEGTYRAVTVLKTIGADFDKQKVTNFVLSFLNQDGGYGSKGISTLASTFYATEIYKLLGSESRRIPETKSYLRDKEENWQIQFTEHLFWLVKGLSNTGEKCTFPEKAINFVKDCQRANGGFSRSIIMGIASLEYTYYALSILREVGAL